jgi:UDP-galactopyranose mutase
MMAYLLGRKGHEVTIVEKNPWLGGLCKTFRAGANKYEFGPHVIHTDKPHIAEIVTRLTPMREARFSVRSCPFNRVDRLFDYPLTVSNILRLDNPEDIIWELYRLNPEQLDRSSLESYVISMIGPTLYNLFIKNYNKKQWGIDPAEMSAKWAPKRIFFSKTNEPPFHFMWSAYPPGGYDVFFDHLTRGIRVVRGAFSSLKVAGNEVQKVVLADGAQVEGDVFVSTIPIDTLLGAGGSLTYRGVYKSFVQIRRKRLIDGLWYTFPNHHKFTRVVEYKGFNFEDNDTTIVSAAFPFDSGEEDTIPEGVYDQEFAAVLQEVFKIKRTDIMRQFGKKDRYSYPVITDGNDKFFEGLLEQLVGFHNLFSVGRLGMFCYVPMCICINQCMKLVDLMARYHMMDRNERLGSYHELR